MHERFEYTDRINGAVEIRENGAVVTDDPIANGWALTHCLSDQDEARVQDLIDEKDSQSNPLADPLAAYNVTGDGNGDNAPLTLTSTREDTGWSAGTFTGTPDRVRITATVFYDIANAGTAQRVSPGLDLLRNGVVVKISSTGYQRHASDHNESSNTIAFIDPSPGTNPTYSLRARRGSQQIAPVPVSLGSIELEAVL